MMNVSCNWLREIVETDRDPESLAAVLTAAGIEVSGLTRRSLPSGVVAGLVTGVVRHPNADKLSVCTVDIGDKVVQVVCGAPNVAPGMRVSCATVGTVLGPTMTITKAKIRGIESAGMLCSERELGISDNHEGIMTLDEECRPGAPLGEYYPDDTVLAIEVTPNRGDCLSMKGVAREVAAATGARLRPLGTPATEGSGRISDYVSVTIEDPQRCPRYLGRLVRGVTIGPSPRWLRDRLSICGLRPINNVVDITNYVMLLFGQPMHAFDYRRISGKAIVVKRAANDQRFVTLDGVERVLNEQDLLICDAEKPVALAGIMGGLNSEIANTTKDVFLECAYFEPAGIRVTRKRLGLLTASSDRFERGVDPADGLVEAMETAAELMRILAGGTVVGGRIDICPSPIRPRPVVLRPSRIAKILGVEIDAERAVAYLTGLGIPCVSRTADSMTFAVPPYRHDITQEIDLIEEIGRLHGYDNIPIAVSAAVSLDRQPPERERRSDRIRDVLAYAGLNEVITPTLVPEKWRALLTPEQEAVKVLNPVSPELAQMRTALAGSMLQVLAHNLNRRNLNNRLFELGSVYLPRPGQKLPDEPVRLAVLLEGDFVPRSWSGPPLPVSFHILKGILERVASLAQLGTLAYKACTDRSSWFDTEAAEVNSDRGVSGVMGRLAQRLLDAFDIRSTVYYAELDLGGLLDQVERPTTYRSLARFPAVERDLAFIVPETVPAAEIAACIRSVSDLIESVETFDLYRGANLPNNHKSLAFSLRLRSPERTLTDAEADGVTRRIVELLKNSFGAELRGR